MSEEKDTSPTVTGDVNALFSVVDSLSWQKIISDIDYLSSTINKPDLTYLYKLVHWTSRIHIFPSAHGIFIKMEYILGHAQTMLELKQ